MKFDVTVLRTEFREHVFRIEAEDRNSAFDAAMEEANNYNFLDSPIFSAEESITSIFKVD